MQKLNTPRNQTHITQNRSTTIEQLQSLEEEIRRYRKQLEEETVKQEKIDQLEQRIQELEEATGETNSVKQAVKEALQEHRQKTEPETETEAEPETEPETEEEAEEIEQLREILTDSQEELLDALETEYKQVPELAEELGTTYDGAAGRMRTMRNKVRENIKGYQPSDLFISGKNGYRLTREAAKLLGKETMDEEEEEEEEKEESRRIDLSDEALKPGAYSLTGRKKAILEAIEEADAPGLTMKQIASEVYNVPFEQVETKDQRYNRILSAVTQLKKDGSLKDITSEVVSKGRKKVWGLPDTEIEETEDGEKPEVNDYEQLKRKAGIDDRDAEIMVNTFEKLVDEVEAKVSGDEKFISYHGSGEIPGFEQYFSGDMMASKAWQKLFSNPKLLDHIRKKVAPEKKFSWTRKGEGGSPRDWVIELK